MYNFVKTQILLAEPLPRINRVFSLVLQQERHLNEGMWMDTKIMVNNASQRINNKTTTPVKVGVVMKEEKEKNMKNSVLIATRWITLLTNVIQNTNFHLGWSRRWITLQTLLRRRKIWWLRLQNQHTMKLSMRKFLKLLDRSNFNNW